MLCLYQSHRSHILEKILTPLQNRNSAKYSHKLNSEYFWQTSSLKDKRYIIINTRRQCQFESIFRIRLYYYNSSSSIKAKDKPYIGLTQENSIEFLVQSIYLIYTSQLVCVRPYLTYFKDHALSMRSIYIYIYDKYVI